eukprot:c27708_g1_i1.p1 GENE.c27708_g1_i1~~c27708_g1_i1.p1  ORF type:complete len:199 (-),score=73.58 c27708_g1_i1:143-682(-)
MNIEGQQILFSEEVIAAKIKELAEQIKKDYANEDVILVCVLNGAFMFFTDLVKCIGPSENVYVDFIMCSSYSGAESEGSVKFLKDMKLNPKDKNLLLVEDIVDTGHTMSTLMSLFKVRHAKSVKLISLFDKPERRLVDIHPDYVGFKVDKNAFIVGYGLDYNEKYRNLPYVTCLNPDKL